MGQEATMDLSQLTDVLRNEIAYPAGMQFVEKGILGRGFCPGCCGFLPENDPIGGVMLLGRDFGVKSYYDGLVGSPARDETALTWRHTRDVYLGLPLLPSLGDLPVWCTNYLMGIRLDGSAKGNIKDRVSEAEWVKYEDSCWKFLHKQVFLQMPLIIVVFGDDNRSDLLSEKRLGRKWAGTLLEHTFEYGGSRHSACVTFVDHPHSLIRHTAKEAARLEVKRIRDLFYSLKRQQSLK
jgi:hypothetical protein